MTATPIPRTLALMFFGDLECTYLKDRPANRAPVRTSVLSPSNIAQAYDAVRLEVSKGRQAYVVCPLVGTGKAEDDEERMRSGTRLAMGEDLSDPRAATARAAFLAEKVFPDFEVGLLTGRMRSEEKIDVMDRFRSGAIQVLVATTVIEVGVDVPNATVMVIDGADCFGLSQLHQLRGRVGRGDEPGQVFLVADTTDEVVDERMRILSTTDDGFELASCDLAMRHEGDVLGSRQSGRSTLSLVDVTRDGRLIEVAHAEAVRLLDKDPGLAAPEHRLLAFEVERLSRRMETGGEA
jgi:ATP-dependent DNA helicase RecG